jgi:farnesyl-diphosphate farnesyltransferase
VFSRRLRLLLKSVSRSFYLSVRVLPDAVRTQVAVAYLLARAADTLADAPYLPLSAAQRCELLGLLRAAVSGQTASAQDLLLRLHVPTPSAPPTSPSAQAELVLISMLGECLACFSELSDSDRALVERVLGQLIFGMERDLRRFPSLDGSRGAISPALVVALNTRSDLDEYTYYAAGCVGEFWTDLMAAHIPALRHLAAPELRQRGVALGKALQMVNVVRDVAADLRAGRCYWPAELLRENGLTPQRFAEQLAAAPKKRQPDFEPESEQAAGLAAATAMLISWAQDHCAEARPYVNAIPAKEVRLRLACAWPLLLALDTLRALSAAESPLAQLVKVPRRRVYELLLRSSAAALADLPAGSRHLDRLFAAH